MRIRSRKEPSYVLPHKRWVAIVTESPWGDDSDPEGYGETQEQAVKNALTALKNIRDEINEFLDSEAKGE